MIPLVWSGFFQFSHRFSFSFPKSFSAVFAGWLFFSQIFAFMDVLFANVTVKSQVSAYTGGSCLAAHYDQGYRENGRRLRHHGLPGAE